MSLYAPFTKLCTDIADLSLNVINCCQIEFFASPEYFETIMWGDVFAGQHVATESGRLCSLTRHLDGHPHGSGLHCSLSASASWYVCCSHTSKLLYRYYVCTHFCWYHADKYHVFESVPSPVSIIFVIRWLWLTQRVPMHRHCTERYYDRSSKHSHSCGGHIVRHIDCCSSSSTCTSTPPNPFTQNRVLCNNIVGVNL